jgi:hypothetical protein
MFSILITPIVVLLLDSAGPAVVLQRLANTAIGCTVVLSAGYVSGSRRAGLGIAARSRTARTA